MSNLRIPFGIHIRPLQALQECQICLQKFGLVVSIITNVVAIATKVQPINWTFIPDRWTSIFSTWPIWPTVMTVSRKELRKKSSHTCVPWNPGHIRSETYSGMSSRGSISAVRLCMPFQLLIDSSWHLNFTSIINSPRSKWEKSPTKELEIKGAHLPGCFRYGWMSNDCWCYIPIWLTAKPRDVLEETKIHCWEQDITPPTLRSRNMKLAFKNWRKVILTKTGRVQSIILQFFIKSEVSIHLKTY